MFKRTLFSTFIAFSAIFAYADGTSAYDFQSDSIYYKILNSTNKTVCVSYDAGNRYKSETINIPSTVSDGSTTYTVIEIKGYAFQKCPNLTSITLPSTITAIGKYAFSESGLKSFTVPDAVKKIDSNTFKNCASLSSVTIPSAVTTINGSAFEGCTSLSSIAIPNSVTSIKSAAFKGCSKLAKLTIPEGVTSVGIYAFQNCTALKSITINSHRNQSQQVSANRSARRIGSTETLNFDAQVFNGCSALSEITVASDYVPTIQSNTFDDSHYLNVSLTYSPSLASEFTSTDSAWSNFTIKTLTGTNTITEDFNTADTVYYNLQGVRVDNASSPGLYIKRQGNTVTKVLIK